MTNKEPELAARAEEVVQNTSRLLRERLQEPMQRGRDMARAAGDKIGDLVEEYPMTCLLGAAGIGFMVARLFQKR